MKWASPLRVPRGVPRWWGVVLFTASLSGPALAQEPDAEAEEAAEQAAQDEQADEDAADEKAADADAADEATADEPQPGDDFVDPGPLEWEPPTYIELPPPPPTPGYVPGYGGHRTLSLSPHAPRYGAPPGGLSPARGAEVPSREWRFLFSGYMDSALRIGIGERDNATADQRQTTFHSTPIVPGRYSDFEATQAVPGPWVQLNFKYGIPKVQATVIIAGFNQQRAASYSYPSSQLGINDAYLTFKIGRVGPLRLNWLVGAFQERYGAMAQYSEGNYGHAMIASARGAGETVSADFDVGPEMVVVLEHGLKGSLDKAPIGAVPNDANAYADEDIGATFLQHAHVGALYKELELGLHWLRATANDDRFIPFVNEPGNPAPAARPDGKVETFGLHARMIGDPYRHFFAGVGYTTAENARPVGRTISILNVDGGRGLMEEYLGMESGGNGSLIHAGLQYDWSLQKFLKYPAFFNANDWDLTGSIFTTFVHVNSDQQTSLEPGIEVKFDGVNKWKMGTEVTYQVLPWFGVSTRYDYVAPDLSDTANRSFHIISPKVIFKTSFLAHELINIRYTRWFYGDNVLIQTVAPNDPQGLDEHMVALQASMYW